MAQTPWSEELVKANHNAGQVYLHELLLTVVPFFEASSLVHLCDSLAYGGIWRCVVKHGPFKLWPVSYRRQNCWDRPTFGWTFPISPTWSHRPAMYCPTFSPPWFPDRPHIPMTADFKIHFPDPSTWIQCNVTPMKPAEVVSAVHPSQVMDALPGILCFRWKVSLIWLWWVHLDWPWSPLLSLSYNQQMPCEDMFWYCGHLVSHLLLMMASSSPNSFGMRRYLQVQMPAWNVSFVALI